MREWLPDWNMPGITARGQAKPWAAPERYFPVVRWRRSVNRAAPSARSPQGWAWASGPPEVHLRPGNLPGDPAKTPRRCQKHADSRDRGGKLQFPMQNLALGALALETYY